MASSSPGSSPSSRAEIAWRICRQVIRRSRPRSSGSSPVSSVGVDELTRLFLAARDGDRTALLHAVRAGEADVWRLARHLVGPDEADDVTQDTFVARRGGRCRSSGATPAPAPGCCRSPGGRAPTRCDARCAVDGSPTGPSGRSRAAPGGARPPIRATSTRSRPLIDELPRDQRAAFVLTQIVGCSYVEAAEACGVPVGTIRSRVRACTRAIGRDAARRRDRMTHRARGLRAVALVGAVVGGLLVVTAAPAAAHGVGGLTPTNYETVLQRVTPELPGLTLKIVDLGTQVELTNTGRRTVLVRGYDDEPYLRVGPRGVFENTRSPATYLNRSTTITGRPPARADADAAPEWRKISSGDTVALARPPRALHGRRRSPGGRARPGHPAGDRPVPDPDARRRHRGRRARSDRLRAAAVAVAVGHRRGRARGRGVRGGPHARVAHGVRRRDSRSSPSPSSCT